MPLTVSPERCSFRVAEACSVEFAVRSDRELVPGDTVEFQFPNSWSLLTGPSYTRDFQASDPARPHHVGVTAGGDAAFAIEIRPRHLNFPEGEARHGRHVVATLARGRVAPGRPVLIRYANTFAPYVAETETLWLRVKGEAPERPPELVALPGPQQVLRVIAPSGVEAGRPFDVLVVSLDRFDNVSCTEFKGQPLRLSDGTVVADGVSFVGSVRVSVRLDAGGVYRFVFADTISNAIRVAAGVRGPYWGDLHIHTKLSSDGQGAAPYGYARDVSGLDFAAVADHSDSLGPEGYRVVEAWAEAAHDPGRFVSILADERNPPALTGHHNIYFRDLDTFRTWAALPGPGLHPTPEAEAQALRVLDPARAMLVPHHTGIAWRDLPAAGIGSAVDWAAWDDSALRLVMEIYSHHGQSELYSPQHMLAYEVNRMRNPERRANTSVIGPYYAQDHWMAGRRLGVVGSSDEHSGQGGRRHGGLAAVFADALSREALFDALRLRRCYATTGERILLEFSVDGVPMGGSAARAAGAKLAVRLDVWGTATLLRVEILRFRFGSDAGFRPIVSVSPRPESFDASVYIEDEFSGRAVYYARVTQEPLEWPGMAWSSPVWIDAA